MRYATLARGTDRPVGRRVRRWTEILIGAEVVCALAIVAAIALQHQLVAAALGIVLALLAQLVDRALERRRSIEPPLR